MKIKKLAFIFALTVLAQLWVPSSMIISSEHSLASGKTFKFTTEPVDPYDAFRGKHITLEFEASNLREDIAYQGPSYQSKKAYALISEDINGFAEVMNISEKRPKSGYYVKGKIYQYSSTVKRFDFPFNKFFLEESKAEKAELLYEQQNQTQKENSYAIIRVGLNGNAIIEDLVIGGIPIKEALR